MDVTGQGLRKLGRLRAAGAVIYHSVENTTWSM
jgi:hypothetical protein